MIGLNEVKNLIEKSSNWKEISREEDYFGDIIIIYNNETLNINCNVYYEEDSIEKITFNNDGNGDGLDYIKNKICNDKNWEHLYNDTELASDMEETWYNKQMDIVCYMYSDYDDNRKLKLHRIKIING